MKIINLGGIDLDYKKFLKILGSVVVCVGVIVFLYGRMNMDYDQYEMKKEQSMQQEQNDKNVSEFPKTYKKEVDKKLKFDVEVVCAQEIATKGVSKATAMISSLNEQKMYKYFMGETSNVQKEINENYRGVDGKLGNVTSYIDENRCELWVADKEGAYAKQQIDYIHNSFSVDKNADEYNGNLYSKTSDLSFMGRTEAWNDLIESMKNIGIDLNNISKKEVYSLDVETLQKEEKNIDVEGNAVEEEKNPNWSKADEGYYYFLGQQFEGLPIYEEYRVGMGEEQIDTSPLIIYQTADGISYLYLSRWFSIQEQEEKYQLAPFEKIMDAIEEKYTGTVMTNPLKVEKATLYEYPVNVGDNAYTLVPVWICSLAEELPDAEGNTYINYFQIPINAVTGEEMPELEE